MDNIFSTYRSTDPIPDLNDTDNLENYAPEFNNPLEELFNNMDSRLQNKQQFLDNKYQIKDWFNNLNYNMEKKNTDSSKNYTNIKGFDAFSKAYDAVEKKDPEAKKYRKFLTDMAYKESGFNSAIQNRAGAPAYGYFQFMQDGKNWNNITKYAGTDISTFRNSPELQIEAAIKLAKDFEKGFSQQDISKAKSMGYGNWALIAGAWLAGNGGVRKFLNGQGNPSDRKWSKSGAGSSVKERMDDFNY